MQAKKIIHIDMDCFYAAIEMRNNPALCDKPLAVGGKAENRGVLTTCNYTARQYGLHSAMPTAQAVKLCPQLILLPVNMPLYREVSQQIQHILARYTDIIEPLSLDEAYLDVTDSPAFQGSATWIAQDIRQTIFNETGLTASAGVAPLKFLAKIASDKNKPNGQFVIKPEEVANFIRHLPLAKIPGVGKVSKERLDKMGLHTCADIQAFPRHILLDQFGKNGERIWQFSHGIDPRSVETNRLRKSISVEITLLQDISELAQALPILQQLYRQLLLRIEKYDNSLSLANLKKLSIKLKFDDFHITTQEKQVECCSLQHFYTILESIWHRRQARSIRLIGLQVQLPSVNQSRQMSLWD